MDKKEQLALLFVKSMPIDNEWTDILEPKECFNEILVNRYRKDVYRIAYTHEQTFGFPKIDCMIDAEHQEEFLTYLNKACVIATEDAEEGLPRMGWYYDNIEPEFLAKLIAYFYK